MKRIKLLIIVIVALLIGFVSYSVITRNNNKVEGNVALQQYKESLPKLKKKAQENPDDYIVNKEYAYALYVTNNNDEAIEIYKKVVDLNPQDSTSLNNLANLYRKSKNFTEARAYYERSISVLPKQVNAYVNLSHMLIYDTEEKEKGYEVFIEAINNNPDNTNLKLMLAKTYEQQKEYEKAILIYEEILEKDPGNLGAVEALKKIRTN
jgi:tetratricopeptide (TPR) repeat protein